jgi:hypothetical protein
MTRQARGNREARTKFVDHWQCFFSRRIAGKREEPFDFVLKIHELMFSHSLQQSDLFHYLCQLLPIPRSDAHHR